VISTEKIENIEVFVEVKLCHFWQLFVCIGLTRLLLSDLQL